MHWEREINMKNIDKFIEDYRIKYEEFITGCDAIEEAGLWDTETYGEMESFYTNDLVSMIVRLIAVDGKITRREAIYLDQTFEFNYTLDELIEVYNDCKDNLGEDFDKNFKQGIDLMRGINARIADSYKELLTLICEIIIESDGVVAESELAEVKRLKSMFDCR